MNIEKQFTFRSLKEIAITFLKSIASGEVREAYQKYIDPDFIHHNAFFPSDANSLMQAMEKNATENPNKLLEVKLALQEENIVTVYSHIRQNPKDLGVAVVHIFRFKDDLIVEMWDVGQPIPMDSPNENGMF